MKTKLGALAVLAVGVAVGVGVYKKMKPKPKTVIATFAGGCFWCMQPPFQNLEGVSKVVSGYAGGTEPSPTYEDYAQKGYIEAIQVSYDPAQVSYNLLLDTFWRQIDPTDAQGQFSDRGQQYSSAIFYHNNEQKRLAEASKQALEKSGRFAKPIVTAVLPLSTFHPAEEYHQDYGTKNPVRYKIYRYGSGRDQFLKKVWGKDAFAKEVLRKRLTPMQYKVTQENATEEAFKNEYWDNEKPGIYVDVVSGEPLFSSLDKFKSGTGWPSFTKPLAQENVVLKREKGLFSSRTEVRSKKADSHLGHLFNDGPKPTGLRYCINSAALRFIPVKDLKKEGLEKYETLFKKKQ